MTQPSSSTNISGWLSKWSNNSGKYEKMWFELGNGMLSCFVKENDRSPQICHKQIKLAGGVLDFDETCKFTVWNDGESVHVKAEDHIDKQQWVNALKAAIHVASGNSNVTPGSNKNTDQTVNDSEEDKASLDSMDAVVRTSQENSSSASQDSPLAIYSPAQQPSTNDITMQDYIDACNKIADMPNYALQSLMSTMKLKLEAIQSINDLIANNNVVFERSIAALEKIQEMENFQEISANTVEYKENASALTKACTEFINLAEYHESQWINLFQFPIEQRTRIENMLNTLLGTESKSSENVSEDDDGYEYFDCPETELPSDMSQNISLQVYQAVDRNHPVRRTRITDRPAVSDSLWSVLKNCIGSDISKMPLPVSFAEPLSLLQRLTEDFEYAHVLDTASGVTDLATQCAYVAAFISSSYSTTIGRSGKPFNPLLGETYECDRQSDLGWRSIAEQVSHHPPVAALYGEGKTWQVWMDQSMKTKFKGTTLTVIPLGECHLSFTNGNRYSWKKPNTSIHNIIVGKLWVEQEGDVNVHCATGDVQCKLSFAGSGWTGENYSLKGVIKDGSGKAVFDIVGKYSTQIEYRRAGSKEPGTVIWKRNEPLPDCAKYYNFTLLACQLNEMENGVAPTDSRFRPDQRLMEEGQFDAANAMKKRLEAHQRANKKETWTPSWFKQQPNPDTKSEMWTYAGEYWQCKVNKDWSRCPTNIFSPPDP